MEQERAYYKAQNDAQQFAGATVQELSKYPGMDDPANRQAVAQAIKAMQLTSDDPRDLRIATDAAWRQVVLPKLQTDANRKVLTHIHATAAASSVNPSATGTAAPKSIEDMTTAEYMRHLSGAGA